MLGSRSVAVAVTATLILLGGCTSDKESGKPEASGTPEAAPQATATQGAAAAAAFKAARLIVETNATDGDAGFQLFLDHDPWKSVSLYRPDGTRILDINTDGVLSGYGLTELFSESSEPPFEKFPLDEFKKLFPPGGYRLTGTTIKGEQVESTVTFTHDFPPAPKVLTPKDESTVPAANLTVTWEPVTQPGIQIVGYKVEVVKETEPGRAMSVDLPAGATRFVIPAEFFEPGSGEYKVEVMAVEKNRHQTFTEVAFEVD